MADQATPTEKAPEPAKEQLAMMKAVRKLNPEAKVFEPRNDGKYYGPVVVANKDFIVQQVGGNTFVAHPRSQLGDLPLDHDKPGARALAKLNGAVVDVAYEGARGNLAHSNPDRWYERAARTPASELHTELARATLGPNVTVSNAPSQQFGMGTRYEGIVAAVTDTHLIQRIDSRNAIVHDVGADLAKQFGQGQQVAVQYDGGLVRGVDAIEKERARDQQRPARDHGNEKNRDLDPETARRNSFFQARRIVMSTYGPDTKVYDANKVGQDPKFTGTVVAVTDHHVMQRVSANKVIAHERSALLNEVKRGAFVELAYSNGKAQATEREVRRDKQRTQERSNGQGISR